MDVWPANIPDSTNAPGHAGADTGVVELRFAVW